MLARREQIGLRGDRADHVDDVADALGRIEAAGASSALTTGVISIPPAVATHPPIA